MKENVSGSLVKDLFVKLNDAENVTSVPCRTGPPKMQYFPHYAGAILLPIKQTLLENNSQEKK